MPTYDYICESCGYEFEQFQTITAKSIRKCPKCGKRDLKRLIGTGAGVIFKGSGFYQTDYRSESYKKAEKSEKNSTDLPVETRLRRGWPRQCVGLSRRGPDTAGTAGKDTAKKENTPESKDTKSTDKTEPTTKDKKKSA